VFSLLSKVATNGLFATSAMPSFGCVPFSHSTTAGVMSISTYVNLLVVASGTLAAIVVPSDGTVL